MIPSFSCPVNVEKLNACHYWDLNGLKKNRKAHFQNLSNSFLMGMRELDLGRFPFGQNFWLSVQLVEMSIVCVGRLMEIIWKKRPLQVLHFFFFFFFFASTSLFLFHFVVFLHNYSFLINQ